MNARALNANHSDLYVSTCAALPPNQRRIVANHYVRYENVTKTDAQVLQCNASNKHGYIFSNSYLNVLGELLYVYNSSTSARVTCGPQDQPLAALECLCHIVSETRRKLVETINVSNSSCIGYSCDISVTLVMSVCLSTNLNYHSDCYRRDTLKWLTGFIYCIAGAT